MTTKNKLFLKVLNENMQSCNGGIQEWQIGKTVTVEGKIEMCKHGIHLTLQPSSWNGKCVFIAETSKVYAFEEEGMKAVCRNATLLMKLSPIQLKAYEEGKAQLWKAYEEGKAQLRKAFEEGIAPLWKAYEEGKAQLRKAYEEGKAQLRKAYKEGIAPLWKAYEEGIAPLWKAYEEGEAQLLKVYKEGCQTILQQILKGES